MLDEQHNEWRVIDAAPRDAHGHDIWLCRCTCGTTRLVQGHRLRSGESRSCGCLSRARTAVGDVYGRLEVLGFSHRSARRHDYWKCRCSCANETVVKGSDLRSGKSRSCGCLQKEVSVSPRPSFPVKWHTFTCANGLPISLQGSYEVAVAELMDRHGKHFTPHPLPGHRWVDADGKVRHYFPDFYVTAIDTFVDAKNMWVLERDRKKLQRVAAQNPQNRYFIADGDFLKKIGIIGERD